MDSSIGDEGPREGGKSGKTQYGTGLIGKHVNNKLRIMYKNGVQQDKTAGVHENRENIRDG